VAVQDVVDGRVLPQALHQSQGGSAAAAPQVRRRADTARPALDEVGSHRAGRSRPAVPAMWCARDPLIMLVGHHQIP